MLLFRGRDFDIDLDSLLLFSADCDIFGLPCELVEDVGFAFEDVAFGGVDVLVVFCFLGVIIFEIGVISVSFSSVWDPLSFVSGLVI